MEQLKVHTEFAPAERASNDDIERQRRLFQKAPLMTQMLDAIPDIMTVLNRELKGIEHWGRTKLTTFNNN